MTATDTQRASGGRDCNLGELLHFSLLPADVLSRLHAICRVRSYQSGQVIVEAGETNVYVGLVWQGILRMEKTLSDGRQNIVGLLVDGDLFGRVFDGPSEFSIEAATDAVVYTFPRPDFEKMLAHSPELDRIVLLNILNELDRARDWMVLLANSKVKIRLAGFLLMLCSRYRNVDHILRARDGELEVKIPISRIDLAALLGTRPESISRAFHALEDDESISILRPDLVRIRDLDKLCDEAGEDFFELRGSVEKLLKLVRSQAP